MFVARKILFFFVALCPDFSFIHIIDIVTHNRTPLFLRLVIVICYCFSFAFLIDEICSLFLPLMICSNIHIHIFKTREKKRELNRSNNYKYNIYINILFNKNILSRKDINPLDIMTRLYSYLPCYIMSFVFASYLVKWMNEWMHKWLSVCYCRWEIILRFSFCFLRFTFVVVVVAVRIECR